METLSAYSVSGLRLFLISFLFLKNRMFRTLSRFVLRAFPVTVRYSQLRIPKKKAPQASWPIASCSGVKRSEYSLRKTDRGRHFCCFLDGSASTYPRSWRVRKSDVWPSASRAGSARRFVRKDERTCVTAALTVPPLSSLSLVFPCSFRRQLPAKAERRRVRCA